MLFPNVFWNLYWVYIYVTLSINSLWQYSFVIFLILFSSLNRMARVLSFMHLSKNLFWFCRSFYCMFTMFINFWVYLNFFLPSIFLVFILLPFFSLLALNALLINLPPLFFPSVNHQTNSISSSSIWLPHSSFHKECFHCCTILMVIIYVIIFPLTYGLFISWLLAWNIWNNN